jgi:RNA polymerase sigma-70 factor (ECF subfamily)
MRITRQKSLAEDAAHDVFLQIWRQAGRFDASRGRADVWLLSLARYRAIDIIRRRQREIGGYEGDDAASEDVDALGLLIADAEGQALRRCMSQLDESRRKLIDMAFIEGLSHSALALRLAVPLGTIKSTIRRSLSSLRHCLES